MTFLTTLVLGALAGFYFRFVLKRFGTFNRPLPRVLRRLSRAWRLALGWLGLALTFVLVIPAVLVALYFLIGMDVCTSLNPPTYWRCTTEGRIVLGVFAVAVLAPLGGIWGGLLNALLAYRGGVEGTGERS